MGELAPFLRHMTIPHEIYEDGALAYNMLAAVIGPRNLISLATVYIDMADTPTFVDHLDPVLKSKLFNNNSVTCTSLRVADTADAATNMIEPALSSEVIARMKELGTVSSVARETFQSHFVDASPLWCITTCASIPEIGGQIDAFENHTLMHPTGVTWWSWIEDRAPKFVPTHIFADITDHEIVDEDP